MDPLGAGGHMQSLAAAWVFVVLSCRMGHSVMAFGLSCSLSLSPFCFLPRVPSLPLSFSVLQEALGVLYSSLLLLITKAAKLICWATRMELADLSSGALTLP